jgi:hypothetical protein
MGKQAKFTGYFKLINAEPTPAEIVDNTSFDSMSVGNITGWYSNIVTGSGNRMARYQEYDLMDTDVEVSRALDIIAEEMTNGKRDDLLNLDIEDDTLSDSEQVTLNVALKRWVKLNKLDTKLFHIARNLVKYGDTFFRRPEPFAEWDHIPVKQVTGAMVDQNNARRVIGWVINIGHKSAQAVPYQMGTKREELSTESAHKIVRFSLNNDMSDSAPFGKSILASVYKAYQQKKLIEDSIIIYRVQRAPERRVFYIDVGRMPPQRRKAYIDQIKLEMRQRKVPALSNGGESTVDNIYDPHDMMEDFYLAQGAEGKGSKIEVLPGGQNLGDMKDLEYFSNKLFEGLRIPINWYRSDSPAQTNDGKVGMAYIQELRFSKFIERLQEGIASTLDTEFKAFLRNIGIKIDPNVFEVRLPEPSNFGSYRQAEMDSTLLNTFSTANGIPFLSPRFALKRFLQLTENEMIENERLLREEKNVQEDDPLLPMKLYQPDAAAEMGGGGGGAGFGGGGGDFDLGGGDDGGDFGDLGGDEGDLGGDAGGAEAGGEEPPLPEPT